MILVCFDVIMILYIQSELHHTLMLKIVIEHIMNMIERGLKMKHAEENSRDSMIEIYLNREIEQLWILGIGFKMIGS